MARKPNWLFKQSAVIPYILDHGVKQVVLITSKSSKKWVIPKGVIERFMSPEESAAKEALEEAGVMGDVSSEIIAEYEYSKWDGICHVKVYPLEVSEILDTWDEMEKRERRLVEASKAIVIVKPELQKVMQIFYEKYC